MKRLCAIVLFVTMTAVAARAEDPVEKPGVLTKEDIFTTKRLSAYTTIVVKDFDISSPALEHLDQEEQKKLAELKPVMVKNLSEAIVSKLKDGEKFKVVERNGKGTKNTVIVEGKFTMLNGGVGGAKWALGFMAPKSTKTHIDVSGRLIDAATGKELATFEESETGVRGASWTQGFDDAFPKQAEGAGENIGEFIEKLY